jgi:hypothetical protein
MFTHDLDRDFAEHVLAKHEQRREEGSIDARICAGIILELLSEIKQLNEAKQNDHRTS